MFHEIENGPSLSICMLRLFSVFRLTLLFEQFCYRCKILNFV